ncbi:3-dehydroquinate dehydratase [Paenibacillus arenilitoris]|uniref:3-dehydroquinate dehydratase n=1 Tax=Paenibacillus arenilitoris TaxID=2772299 RepID=A0A927H4M8_9BACL|nr:3-dehydroquinate dehydratase [Paenibacillus arenilitoris]MBD2868055.1 3-dehydroquinate dehydratase [Paenibacillus arenilitoris]
MKTTMMFQNKLIPVYLTDTNKQAIEKLTAVLNRKLETGKNALKTCIKSLISVEIVGSEATLHSFFERDTLTISLY